MKKTVLLLTMVFCASAFAKQSFKLTTLSNSSRQVGGKTRVKVKKLKRPLEIEKKGQTLVFTSKPNDKRKTIIDHAKTVSVKISVTEATEMVKALEDLLVSATYNAQIKSEEEKVFFQSKKRELQVYYLPKDKEEDRKKYEFWLNVGGSGYLLAKRDLSKIASATKREAARKGK